MLHYEKVLENFNLKKLQILIKQELQNAQTSIFQIHI